MARGRGRTAAGSRSAGGRAYLLNGFLPALHPLLQATAGGVPPIPAGQVRPGGPQTSEVGVKSHALPTPSDPILFTDYAHSKAVRG